MMRLPKNGMLFMMIVIIVMTGIMIIANTNYQYRAALLNSTLESGNIRNRIQRISKLLWSKFRSNGITISAAVARFGIQKTNLHGHLCDFLIENWCRKNDYPHTKGEQGKCVVSLQVIL